jgi:predicted enzyme related to lactoylglutathione lyase
MPRVVHFEIPADDPQRAVTFYEKIFGWEINNWGGPVDYWLVKTGNDDEPGINGAIKRRVDQGGTVNTISVASIDEATLKVVEAGGSIVTQKATIPGIGYHAYCKDTEGNIFGILEADESAR